VNHCHLFESPEDYEKALGLLKAIKEDLGLEVHAYVLMSNHVHLLAREKSRGDIVLAMSKLLGPYANWFNKKYLRSGALIANRYKSECVEDDGYLLQLVRYIHQNPILSGAVKRIADYRWSSYSEYIKGTSGLVDTGFVLGIFSDDSKEALQEFTVFHEIQETRDFSNPERRRQTEAEAFDGISTLLGDIRPSAVCGLPKQERDRLLVVFKKEGYSIRQIERVTGISRSVIARAL